MESDLSNLELLYQERLEAGFPFLDIGLEDSHFFLNNTQICKTRVWALLSE
jgi:hypothetical protein